MPRKDKSSKDKEATYVEWGEWSEWQWDGKKQKYYQYRYDATGNVEHKSSRNPFNPRGDAGVEQMTAHFGQTHLSSASEGNENQDYNLYTTPESSVSHDYEQNVPGMPEHSYAQATHQPISDAQHPYGHAYAENYGQPYVQAPGTEQQPGLQTHHGSQGLLNSNNDNDYVVPGTDAGPSFPQTPYDDYGQSYNTADAASYYNPSATPKPSAQRPRRKFRGEYMDPQYDVLDSREFRPGRIVKVWWPEGKGHPQNRQSTINSQRNYRFDQLTYEGFRRFIIVWPRNGSCTVIPISTYGGQGCAKRGIHPEDHGIIHDRRYPATLLPMEPQLGADPVQAEMYGTEETLTDASRVNYAKLHNLEHNVPVWFVGELAQEALEMVEDAVWKCLDQSSGSAANVNHQRERPDRHRSGRERSSREKSDKHKKSKR